MLEQLIREKAYQIWEQEGHPDGRADAHWQLALRMVEAAAPQPVATPNKKAAGKLRTKKKI